MLDAIWGYLADVGTVLLSIPLNAGEKFYFLYVLTFIALACLGILRWSATGERLLRSVGETILIGTVCAAVAFFVGWLVGG